LVSAAAAASPGGTTPIVGPRENNNDNNENKTLEERAIDILKTTPLIDGHNDLAYFLRWAHSNHIYLSNFTTPFETGKLGGEVDLFRLRKGHVGGTFWSIYVDCPKGGNYTEEYFRWALGETTQAIDLINRLTTLYPTYFSAPSSTNSHTALPLFRSSHILSPLGLEGLHMLGSSFATLRSYHQLGIRYATLTHNCHNAYADSAMTDLANGSTVPATPLHHGVSELGRKVVAEMNRLGIFVDLSHTSADTMRDILGAGKPLPTAGGNGNTTSWTGTLAPPIFSHSSAFALCPHPRNVPDDVLYLLKARDGVVMVTFWADFISCYYPNGTQPSPGSLPTRYEPNVTLSQVVRHMRYIGDLIGYEHVGIGSDFDGVPFAVPGLEDVSKFPNLVVEMLRQGIREEDVHGIVGGNLLRVWGKMDAVAEALQRNGTVRPAEDDLPWLPNPWL